MLYVFIKVIAGIAVNLASRVINHPMHCQVSSASAQVKLQNAIRLSAAKIFSARVRARAAQIDRSRDQITRSRR